MRLARGFGGLAIGLPPHALRNRGMCDRSTSALRSFASFPPHALRNRGMCDLPVRSAAGDQVDPPHALRNRGMCDSIIGSYKLQRITVRLTLFETAGCATIRVWAAGHDFGTASRSSKPRDVRHFFGVAGAGGRGPPHALRNRGMCDRGPALGALPRDGPPHALRNRGMCDGVGELVGFDEGPPHALRNRGMCD